MFHVAAAAVIPPVLMVGGKIVMMAKFDPVGYAELIERHRITFANGVPTMLKMVVDEPGVGQRDLTSLRGMNMGGSPVPPELVRRLIETFPNARFYNTYGMTEVTSASTVSDGITGDSLPEHDWQWNTIGWPTPLTEVAVFRPDDTECAPGEIGELRMRGPLVMKGYWKNPEATRAAIGDGWMRSGDAGYADDLGNFFLVDRIKDMIITGGENVYSTEVETVIRAMPQVSEVAVVGIPDVKWGEAVHAAVVPLPGVTIEEAEVVAWCRARIAGYKTPRSVEIRSRPLPVSGAGKIAKTVLRAERIAILTAADA